EAAGEAQAVAAMEREAASLWLFDYNLDDGDTGTALQARLGERFGPRPTLILSADDSLATRREVMELGLTLLHKPVRPLALKSIMDACWPRTGWRWSPDRWHRSSPTARPGRLRRVQAAPVALLNSS
ncbi:response regulator, partial [Stenotrophomonas pictorum]|uniref:response regulator n=1 Tax=Stenotrophomonas pictorum TaxID=86184 RepID=UPI0012FDDE8E